MRVSQEVQSFVQRGCRLCAPKARHCCRYCPNWTLAAPMLLVCACFAQSRKGGINDFVFSCRSGSGSPLRHQRLVTHTSRGRHHEHRWPPAVGCCGQGCPARVMRASGLQDLAGLAEEGRAKRSTASQQSVACLWWPSRTSSARGSLGASWLQVPKVCHGTPLGLRRQKRRALGSAGMENA